MGKRGPAPAPRGLKLLRGDPVSRINLSEPQPVGDIVPSRRLEPDEQAIWDRLAPMLKAQRVLTSNDCAALVQYCAMEAENDRAWADVHAHGAVLHETRVGTGGVEYGITITNPMWLVVTKTADHMLRIGARFGLTPSDRSQLSVPEAHVPHPADAYLS